MRNCPEVTRVNKGHHFSKVSPKSVRSDGKVSPRSTKSKVNKVSPRSERSIQGQQGQSWVRKGHKGSIKSAKITISTQYTGQ